MSVADQPEIDWEAKCGALNAGMPTPVWDAIPPELSARQQWLVWKYEPPRKGSTKPIKMPYYVTGGRRVGGQGDDKDLMKLATLAVARRVYERGAGKWAGVGFTFLQDDGLIGVDIDGGIDAAGEMTDMCRNVIGTCDSYTELSPSGKGVHIIVKGATTINKFDPIGLELYCGKLYFTFTGNLVPGTPADVREISAEALEGLHSRINQAKEEAAALRQQVLQQASKPAARAPTPAAAGGPEDDFRKVNDIAMSNLDAWVNVLFPSAKRSGRGFRVTSEALGRQLQEDLSIKPEGIVDFGVADMGDVREGRRTPIDLVMEHGGKAHAKEALHWLAKILGVSIRQPGAGERRATRPAPAPAPRPAGAGGGDGGGGPPNDQAHEDEEPPEDDWLQLLAEAIIRKGKGIADCRENVLYCMRHDPKLKGLVAHNAFTELHERTRRTPWGRPPGEWDGEDDLMLGEYLAREHGLLVKSEGTLRAGVLMAAREHRFNPVVDLIRSHKWDGTPRLHTWLADCLGVLQRPYTALVGSLFIKGMVLRATRPGCKFDYMLILKGPQGVKKSTLFRTLAQPWFTDNAIRVGEKDSLMALQSVWVAESSELESLNKAESSAQKQFLSVQDDLFRPPYGARMIKRPRHSVFGGTTNADTFLKDVTGDRRFWPLEVDDAVLNVERLAEIRLQLFAEALHYIEEGGTEEERRTWTTQAEEREIVIPEQEKFRATDVWTDILADYVNQANTPRGAPAAQLPNARRNRFTTIELFQRALEIKADRVDNAKVMENRLANCMKELGFWKYREERGAIRNRGYERAMPAQPASPPPPAAPPPGGPPPPAQPEAQSTPDRPPEWTTEELPDDVPF